MPPGVGRHLASVGLPTGVEAIAGRSFTAARLIDHMGRDKKVEGGRITFVLARGIGQAFLAKGIDLGRGRRHADGSGGGMIWESLIILLLLLLLGLLLRRRDRADRRLAPAHAYAGEPGRPSGRHWSTGCAPIWSR